MDGQEAQIAQTHDHPTIILSRAATPILTIWPWPLPQGLHGAAAQRTVTAMITRAGSKRSRPNLRRASRFGAKQGDGHGTTLVATEVGNLAADRD